MPRSVHDGRPHLPNTSRHDVSGSNMYAERAKLPHAGLSHTGGKRNLPRSNLYAKRSQLRHYNPLFHL
jgi:hypothetical protein